MLDTFAWFGIAIGLPLLIQRPLSNIYHRMLKKRFNLFGDANPLTTSFKTLAVARNQPKAQNKLKKSWGLSNSKNLHTLGKWVLGAKLAIMTVVLFFMAAKNEIYFWGRNWLTKKTTKRDGFSGEFNQVSNSIVENNTKEYQANKKTRQALSMASSITSVIGLPLIVLAAVKSKKPLGKGLLGRLKKLLPAVDYHDTIYMSRWVMFWSNLLTFNTVGYLAARSNNEKREHVVKSVILDVMWFVGDAVFAGLAGQHF